MYQKNHLYPQNPTFKLILPLIYHKTSTDLHKNLFIRQAVTATEKNQKKTGES